jgi:hypothetical protein
MRGFFCAIGDNHGMRLFLYTASAAAALAVWYAVGMREFLFWRLWWYDIPAHFMGGLVIALVLGCLIRGRISLSKAIVLALVVGIGWEVFERYFGLGGNVFMSYALDTTKDMLMDGVGGMAGYFAVRRLIPRV